MHSTLFKSLITLLDLKKKARRNGHSLTVKMYKFWGGGYESIYISMYFLI